jgi:hypothetical protein
VDRQVVVDRKISEVQEPVKRCLHGRNQTLRITLYGRVTVAENRPQNLNPRTGSKNDYFSICQSEETHKMLLGSAARGRQQTCDKHRGAPEVKVAYTRCI